jgi:hypothetical protein
MHEAAPDLLAACEAVMSLQKEPAHVVGQVLTCDLVERIRAAIAKAKGEQ